jgi:hypothetical protein
LPAFCRASRGEAPKMTLGTILAAQPRFAG